MTAKTINIPAAPTWFNSTEEYRGYCDSVAGLASATDKGTSTKTAFAKYREEIREKEVSEGNIIKTGWGGVYITRHEHPQVEKFLVVDGGKYLAFEKHAEKVETLTVKEGLGLLVYRKEGEEVLTTLQLSAGTSITLNPGQEHCIIAINDLLVFEESIDPKGMDKDLIFLHLPA